MSILHVAPAPVKTSRVLFNGCRPIAPTNRHFGSGLARPVREKRVGYTVADLQWAAENLNHDGVTADEAARLAERAMPAEVYHELQAELADCRALARVGCEESFADAYLEAIEAEAIEAPGHQVLRASDGEALAVVLEGLDGSDLQEAADRALAVLAIEGSLPRAAWIARRGEHVAMLDRDHDRKELAFEGRTPLSRAIVESAFGIKLGR